ncbi:MAG: GNAT family N-acetyltransferase [Lachnospiraceae bacterium]|nr:GNAT family N-acetyltransferase [Lachnospiraceae bacterium]
MNLEIIPAYDFPQEVSILFKEYTEMLIAENPGFKDYLALQNYDEEIAHLEVKYGKPQGRLYLAYYEGKLAGCIGLRKIDNDNCEMKRLYVKPEFRGKHIASQMVKKIIEDAKEIGYQNILLDTFPFLESAIMMYKRYGFVEIESYNNSPMQGLVYLKYSL